MGFKTPLPLPAEKGFIIDFGDARVGRGVIEPSRSSSDPVKKQIPKVKEVKETFMTQDVEEAPSIPIKKKPGLKEEKKVTTNENIKEVEVKKEVKEVRKPNPLTMYKGAGSNSSEGQGEEQEAGNKGQEEGINSGSHFVGNAGEMGVADVGDRIASSLPNPEYKNQKEGVVVVKVRVDRSGKVVSALPGVQGSSTLDNYLLEMAKRAALASKFNAKYDGKMFDEGTITYRFKLK